MTNKIITLIPYVDKIYCQATLGEVFTHKQNLDTYGKNREININHNRSELQEEVRNSDLNDIDLVLLMDSDVVATNEQLQALVEAYNGKPIALKTKDFDTGNHICCACCLLSLEDYLSIDYVSEYIDMCQCWKIMHKFGVTYLEGQQAYEVTDREYSTTLFHNEHVQNHSITPIESEETTCNFVEEVLETESPIETMIG